MIKLVINHKYAIEAADIIRLFYGKTEIETINEEALEKNQGFFQERTLVLCSHVEELEHSVVATARLWQAPQAQACKEEFFSKEEKQKKSAVKRTLYKLLSKHCGKSFPWGILTGIRPVKIINDLMDKGFNEQQIKQHMGEHYLTSEKKTRLALEIAQVERPFVYPLREELVSLYAGIPFCPTRCHYCSFTSNSLKACGSYVEDYLSALFYEMEATLPAMNKYGLKVQTIYIGGGTPTTLDAKQLDRLFKKLYRVFGTDAVEFTCEAGRPDTITPEKLEVMKQNGITRISINPQTMNDDTLERIGRAHRAEETVTSFQMAREKGFDHINMDIILGLPGEGLKHLENTLRAIGQLKPESLTVHTMALKRASILHESNEAESSKESCTSQMLEMTEQFARQQSMHPYYLYRQKHMLENLENTGYCKPGQECIYNIQIIEEKQANIAFGADAITKAIHRDTGLIKRQGNIKDLRLYIRNIEEQVRKKLALLAEFYDKER
jgi:coproporphyrinogen dehydrogenase HemZ